MTCALCGISLTGENASREHVFPNAIGGRKSVGNFLCRACNNRTGTEWDNELVRQLRPLCTMLNVRRARRRNLPFVVETVSGRKLAVNPDGSMIIEKPRFEEQELDGKTVVKIHARTTRELRRELRKLTKRHGEIDVDKVVRAGRGRAETGVFERTLRDFAQRRWASRESIDDRVLSRDGLRQRASISVIARRRNAIS